jgi:hypothetical protein
MRVGRVVVGMVVVLAAVAAAFFVHTSRNDDPNDATGSPTDDPCPSGVPSIDDSVWGVEMDKGQHTNSVGGPSSWSSFAEGGRLPSSGFAIDPGALVYAGSPKELRDLASTGTGIGPGPAHAHAHRFD